MHWKGKYTKPELLRGTGMLPRKIASRHKSRLLSIAMVRCNLAKRPISLYPFKKSTLVKEKKSSMLSQEDLYKSIYNQDWSAIINLLHGNKKNITSDPMLAYAAATFENEFFSKIDNIAKEDRAIVEILENIYILHVGNFYKLSKDNHTCLIVELVKRKQLNEAYGYATLLPDEETCRTTISRFKMQHPSEEVMVSVTPTMEWFKSYNMIFELINDQNDTATYFSGPRFINTVREFQPYFPDYRQYIDLRNSEGKSTTRKIFYYDILANMEPDLRIKVIDRILEMVRPFQEEKVKAIDIQLGKVQVIDIREKVGMSDYQAPPQSPVVFISYSWDNEEHKQWVLKLADRLVGDSIHVLLDRYDLRAGKSIPHFVETSISKSDKIIIIFTSNYKLKADKRAGGVGYEYSIMNADLYKNQTSNDKIIPVLRSGTISDSIPTFMQQFIHINITNNANFENSYRDILREIRNEPEIVRPQLGIKPQT